MRTEKAEQRVNGGSNRAELDDERACRDSVLMGACS